MKFANNYYELASDEFHWAEWPGVICKNPIPRVHDSRYALLVLPIPMPPVEDEEIPDWPSETWRATLGCRECGHVYDYTAQDVRWESVPILGRVRSHNANCYRVQAPCPSPTCRTRLDFYVNLHPEETEFVLRKLLEVEKFFQGFCPGGDHKIRPLPQAQYRIERTYGPL